MIPNMQRGEPTHDALLALLGDCQHLIRGSLGGHGRLRYVHLRAQREPISLIIDRDGGLELWHGTQCLFADGLGEYQRYLLMRAAQLAVTHLGRHGNMPNGSGDRRLSVAGQSWEWAATEAQGLLPFVQALDHLIAQLLQRVFQVVVRDPAIALPHETPFDLLEGSPLPDDHWAA